MSMTQLNAVGWRLQVERLVEYANAYDRGLVVVYEDICQDTLGLLKYLTSLAGK